MDIRFYREQFKVLFFLRDKIRLTFIWGSLNVIRRGDMKGKREVTFLFCNFLLRTMDTRATTDTSNKHRPLTTTTDSDANHRHKPQTNLNHRHKPRPQTRIEPQAYFNTYYQMVGEFIGEAEEHARM